MRKFYAFMLFAILSISAFAETDDKYYWYYDKVEAAPTGKGVIYASATEEAPASDSDYAEWVQSLQPVISLWDGSLLSQTSPSTT